MLFAATGALQIVRPHWVKPGATIIDVDINRVAGADGDSRLVGDMAVAEVVPVGRADNDRVPVCEHALGAFATFLALLADVFRVTIKWL
jgi:5,10-methylene-tetrahydrofolate dehydrogenase/methenyl tetrahydrofolate cyclohydrolase